MNLIKKAIDSKFNLVLIWSYIKQKLGNFAVKLLHNSGFYVEKLTTASTFHRKLTRDGIAFKEHELRKTANHLRLTNDLELYDQILRKFVPQMKMQFSNTIFTGTGMGATTLNVYRKVIFGDEVLFEKVYFNSSLDIERVKWFYENIYSALNPKIKVPALYSTFSGELITLFYFKFVDLLPLATSDVDATIFYFSRQLYKLSLTRDIKSKIESAPTFLKDYKAHFEYKRKIDTAKKNIIELLGDNFPLKNIEQAISESPLILTHGDIHPANIFQKKYLIDWDPFGLYPIGLEVAYILYFLHKGRLSYIEIIQIIETEYQSTILEEQWDDFELNFLYFYYVFTIQQLVDEDLSDVQYDILKRIEEVYYRKENKGNELTLIAGEKWDCLEVIEVH